MRAGRGRYSDMARSGSTNSYTPSVVVSRTEASYRN